jgi:hypothetical protein
LHTGAAIQVRQTIPAERVRVVRAFDLTFLTRPVPHSGGLPANPRALPVPSGKAGGFGAVRRVAWERSGQDIGGRDFGFFAKQPHAK